MTTYADLVAQRTELARQQAGLEKQLAEMQKAERQGARAPSRKSKHSWPSTG